MRFAPAHATMPSLQTRHLNAYRARTFRTARPLRLHSAAEAVAFVEERGFVFFWPIAGIDLPSLWAAAAGDRPVASRHDDPGHVTWRWKDELLDQRRWYYGKLLRGKATLASLATLPLFYALSERVDELDDYRQAYHSGLLSRPAHDVAEALCRHGPMDTLRLRREAHLSSAAAKTRFDRALVELQKGLWVVPIGVAEVGGWRYAFVYELFDRWFTETAALARAIDRPAARAGLAEMFLQSVGAARPQALAGLFGWKPPLAKAALDLALAHGRAVRLEDGRWATPDVLT